VLLSFVGTSACRGKRGGAGDLEFVDGVRMAEAGQMQYVSGGHRHRVDDELTHGFDVRGAVLEGAACPRLNSTAAWGRAEATV